MQSYFQLTDHLQFRMLAGLYKRTTARTLISSAAMVPTPVSEEKGEKKKKKKKMFSFIDSEHSQDSHCLLHVSDCMDVHFNCF